MKSLTKKSIAKLLGLAALVCAASGAQAEYHICYKQQTDYCGTKAQLVAARKTVFYRGVATGWSSTASNSGNVGLLREGSPGIWFTMAQDYGTFTHATPWMSWVNGSVNARYIAFTFNFNANKGETIAQIAF